MKAESFGRFQECPLLQEQVVGLIEITNYIVGEPGVPQQDEEVEGKGEHVACAWGSPSPSPVQYQRRGNP